MLVVLSTLVACSPPAPPSAGATHSSVAASWVESNRSLSTQLVLRLELYVPLPVGARCTLLADAREVHVVSGEAARSHALRVDGLLADEDYTCVLEVGDEELELSATTPPLPDGLPTWTVETDGFG